MQTTQTTASSSARKAYAFRLTPAEWHRVLADQSFLSDPDNSFNPRRLMGVPVVIIPDHRFIVTCG
ncbi:MAG: hypothetical protein ACXU82_14530 [Caulobacteraceae bacterium]